MVEYLFRQVFLPYALERQGDGSYVIQSRHYKPVGFAVPSGDHVVYEDHPVRVKMRLTKLKARAISVSGSDNLDQIYLYDDGCKPETSIANWVAYANRLRLLANVKVTLL